MQVPLSSFIGVNLKYAKDYSKIAEIDIKYSNHLNEISKKEKIDQRVIDAVLAGFINYVGIRNGKDYSINTNHLK